MIGLQVDMLGVQAILASVEDCVLASDAEASAFLCASKARNKRAGWLGWAVWLLVAAVGTGVAAANAVSLGGLAAGLAAVGLMVVSAAMMFKESAEVDAADLLDTARTAVAKKVAPGDEVRLPWNIGQWLDSTPRSLR